jgi:uncharacterized membrane protein YdjX (TVP38/TMEM64 family)
MTNNKKNKIWIKPLILMLLAGGFALIFYKTGLIHFFLDEQRVTGFLYSLGPAAFAGFITLQAVQVVASPIPGNVTALLGGFLYGPFLGVILSTIGLTIGSYIAFALSKKFGRPFVEKIVDKSIMARFDYLLNHKGAFLAFFLFLVPGVPKDYLCYILGLGRLSTTKFLIIGGTGRLFGTILLTLGGNYIRHDDYTKFFILVSVAIIVVFIAMAYRDKLERLFRIWHIMDYRKKKAKKIE